MASQEKRISMFSNIYCNGCNELPLIGTRWKCAVCQDYDLCTKCYMSGKHSPQHAFVSFDGPGRPGIKVAARHGSEDFLVTVNPADDIARGVMFRGVSCDACGQRDIVGTRWKCAACFNYDLCTTCHHGGKHSLDHAFLCIKVPGGTAIMVPPRRGTVRAEAVTFLGVNCDACDQRGIEGTRWKCALCFDYDLCTACYVGGKHNLYHQFLRVDVPGGTAEMVASRKNCGTVRVGSIKDNGAWPTGVTFHGINCDGCGKRGIVGARWKCDQCIDYDLCTSCYVANAHSLDHIFWRFDLPGSKGLKISPRQKSPNADEKGAAQEAVKFLGINCDVCGECGIVGTRWKCALCVDYDLCTACYVGGQHNLDHTFLRLDVPGGIAVKVSPRKRSGQVPVEGVADGGIIFPGVNCDGCNKHDIVGPRWKCTSCIDYDLCTACYMTKKHNFDHIFLRFDSPRSKVVKVSPRQESLRAEDTRVSKKAVLFHGIYCDSCDERDIVGPLWKCDSCGNYDLCTTCYMAGVHDLDHGFLRFDAPASRGNKVFPRIRSVLSGEVLDDSETARREQRAVKFMGINCDGCDQRGIVGTRWKCAVCFDYDLCSACYRGDKHHLNHAFLRFDEIGSAG
ncbi:uncharacterized protein LOC144119635 [Amblyomma americanum]